MYEERKSLKITLLVVLIIVLIIVIVGIVILVNNGGFDQIIGKAPEDLRRLFE